LAFTLNEDSPTELTTPSRKAGSVHNAADGDNLLSGGDEESEEDEDVIFDRLYFFDLDKGMVTFEARGPDLNFLFCKNT